MNFFRSRFTPRWRQGKSSDQFGAEASYQQVTPLGNLDARRMSIPRKPVSNQTTSIVEPMTPPTPGPATKEVIYDSEHRNKRRLCTMPNLLSTWGLEFISCIIMVAMLFAIVGTLLPHEGRPLPNWPYHLSINTLVSIWSTILKTMSLLVLAEGLSQLKWDWITKRRPLAHLSKYDSASRGPMGCLQLLITLRGRDLVSSVGALIVILLLAIDPFSQQLVRYYSCQIPSNQSTSSVPRSSMFDEFGPRSGAGTWAITTPLLASIDAGIFNPSFVQVDFNCPSGNCTFPETYSTLGYCSQCIDVSHELKVTFNNISVPSTMSYSNGTTVPTTIYKPYINTTLPSGNYASYCNGADESNELWFTTASLVGGDGSLITVEIIMAATTMNPNSDMTPEQRYPFAALHETETDFPCNHTWAQKTWGCQGPGAVRCTLTPCTRTYSASVVGGKLRETMIANSSDWFYGQGNGTDASYNQADLSCLNTDQKQALRKVGYKFSDDAFWIPYNASVNITNGALVPNAPAFDNNASAPNNDTLSIVSPDCVYTIIWQSVQSIGSYLSTYFNTSISPTSSTVGYQGPSNALTLFNDSFVNFDSIDSRFKGVAESLTNYMRSHGDSSFPNNFSNPALGVVWDSDTCVGVRWGWLAFPAFLVLATLVFFVSMLIHTGHFISGGHAHGWKSSLLPLVFLDLNGIHDTDHGDANINNIGTMKQAADKVHVHIDRTDTMKAESNLIE